MYKANHTFKQEWLMGRSLPAYMHFIYFLHNRKKAFTSSLLPTLSQPLTFFVFQRLLRLDAGRSYEGLCQLWDWCMEFLQTSVHGFGDVENFCMTIPKIIYIYIYLYVFIYHMIWHDTTRHDLIWYEFILYNLMWYDKIWYDMIRYDMIYLYINIYEYSL